MKEEENTNEENKKELLVLAYNTWWKLRAIKNMANMKAKMMWEVLFDNEEDKKEYQNIVLALLNGIDSDLILDMSKNYNTQYVRSGSHPFDIVPVYNGVALQSDIKEPDKKKKRGEG